MSVATTTSASTSSKLESGSGKAVATNPRGIPHAPFIANVEEHVGGPEGDAESTLKQFQEAIAKYQYMEVNLQQRKKGLLTKIPDIEKTLAMVQFLHDRRVGKSKSSQDDEDDLEAEEEDEEEGKKPLTATFELNDTLWAEATLEEESDSVYLWLGANVMLAYTQEEALALLSSKLSAARQNLANAVEDLEFLREQITIMEVNTARCYNWDVKRRREQRDKARLEGRSDEGEKEDGAS
ncbi:Prefoldin, subunit 3 [Clavulina sp. PMI_390]|nr:Prefoldin, subunit 3 [Clavulina sp. PMI_390]